MIRCFLHYVPLNLLVLMLFEALILGGAVYAGVSAGFFDLTGIQSHFELLLPKALTFAVVMLGLMTASGLYDLEWRGGFLPLLQRLGLMTRAAMLAQSRPRLAGEILSGAERLRVHVHKIDDIAAHEVKVGLRYHFGDAGADYSTFK